MHDHKELPDPGAHGLRLGDYGRLLRRHWVAVLVAALVGGALGALVPQLILTRYEATTRLVVQARYPSTSWTEAFDANRLTTQLAASYAEHMADRTTAQTVVDELGLGDDAASLQRRVTVEAVQDTNIITVRVHASTALAAQRAADAYGTAFARRVQRLQPTPAVGTGGPVVSVEVAEPPGLPRSPVAPYPLQSGLLGALLAGFAVLAAVAVRMQTDGTIRGFDDLRTVLPATPAASLPPDGRLNPASPPTLQDHPALHDHLRPVERALLGQASHPGASVLVTSASPREGRTTVACLVAELFARRGQRVVLVDADVRGPGVRAAAQPFGIGSLLGPMALLREDAELDESITGSQGRGYDVLVGGRAAGADGEVLRSAALASLLADLRGRYDVVLVDAAPVLLDPDTAGLAAAVDGVLLVARQGSTTRADLRAAVGRLEAVAAPVLAAVLTCAGRQSRAGRRLRRAAYDAQAAPPRAWRARSGR